MTIKAFSFIENPDEKYIRKDIENEPEKFVKEMLTGSKYSFGVSEILNTGTYKYMGYRYDLKPFLTRYVYQKFERFEDIYALNKTNVRKLVGKVYHLTELK